MGVDAKMAVKLAAPITQEGVQGLALDLAEAVGVENVWIDRKFHFERGQRDLDPNGHCARLVSRDQILEDDGYMLPIGTKPDDTLVKVSFIGRYYGPGYERGNLWVYIAVAEWFEARHEGCEVFYGGDSGHSLPPFGPVERREMVKHWANHGGRPYYEEGGFSYAEGEGHWAHRTCLVCFGRPMVRFGRGKDYASVSCTSCGRLESTSDAGKTWKEDKQ